MTISISMRELQKISAEKIRALKRPVSITSGGETVALLVPQRSERADGWRDLGRLSATLHSSFTAAERTEIARLLGESPE